MKSFTKLACLMDDVLVDREYSAFDTVANATEFGVKLEELFGFTLPEEALGGVYNVVRLLAKTENTRKEDGDA